MGMLHTNGNRGKWQRGSRLRACSVRKYATRCSSRAAAASVGGGEPTAVGFGRIVASDIEAPIMLDNLV
jgi:hypothetical protein